MGPIPVQLIGEAKDVLFVEAVDPHLLPPLGYCVLVDVA